MKKGSVIVEIEIITRRQLEESIFKNVKHMKLDKSNALISREDVKT